MPQDGRDVSAIANCLCCDSYFVYTIDTIPAGTEFRGRSGKDLFEDLLLKKQEKAGNRRGGWLLPCPTCQEVVHKVPWETFVGNFGLDAVLVPSRLVSFEAGELPPLYLNEGQPGGKPKWTLCQGLGPKGLEVDKSKSGRIHKPTLRQYGIAEPAIDAAALDPEECKYRAGQLMTALQGLDEAAAEERIQQWTELRPLYSNWNAVADAVEAAAAAASEDAVWS